MTPRRSAEVIRLVDCRDTHARALRYGDTSARTLLAGEVGEFTRRKPALAHLIWALAGFALAYTLHRWGVL